MIDLSTVVVRGGAAEALTFPVTVSLDTVGIMPGVLALRSRGAESWPTVPVSSDDPPPGSQAATLWIFLRLNGQWFATGAERLRPTQVNGDKPENTDISTLIGVDWLYDVNRWQEMTGYTPGPGELVGFMLVSGSTRSDTQYSVRQRSNILVCRWPTLAGQNPLTPAWREGDSTPAIPVPPPTTNVPMPTLPMDLAGLIAMLTEMRADITTIRQAVKVLVAPTVPLVLEGTAKLPFLGTAPITLTEKQP